MRRARPVQLSSEERKSLEQQSRARSQSARVVERARIVLRAADGLEDKEVAAEFGITPEKAARWRNRFLDGGLAALQKDAPRPGRTLTITEARVKQVNRWIKPDNVLPIRHAKCSSAAEYVSKTAVNNDRNSALNAENSK